MPVSPDGTALDVIGDIHGCLPELLDLLARLGYRTTAGSRLSAPAGRRLVLLGDLVDRGPDSPGVLRLAMGAIADGVAVCLNGNHDDKLRRLLGGEPIGITAGRAVTLRQLEREPPRFVRAVRAFLATLPPRLELDDGRLLVVHAGDRPELPELERAGYNAYGRDLEQRDQHGARLREDWIAGHAGSALVAYGHTPVPEPLWRANTVNLDTGCVYGGRLSALRYPEREVVWVPARAAYATSARFQAARERVERA